MEKVKMYKYISWPHLQCIWKLSIAKQELKKIALKALFKLKKGMGCFFRSKVKVTFCNSSTA